MWLFFFEKKSPKSVLFGFLELFIDKTHTIMTTVYLYYYGLMALCIIFGFILGYKTAKGHFKRMFERLKKFFIN